MTDNTKMREALLKFGDENPSLDLDFRLHTHGKYLTQEKAIVASRAFKAGAAWQAARTVPALHAEQIRVAAVAAIREVTGCPDIKGKDGAYLVDTLIVNLLSAAPEGKK